MPPRSGRRANPQQRARLAELVLESLEFLTLHTSWSTKAVTGLIKSTPRAAAVAAACGCTDTLALGRRVGATLRRGASFGILKRQGTRFRFRDDQHPRGRGAPKRKQNRGRSASS